MMASPSTWVRYLALKLEYSLALSVKSYRKDQISDQELIGIVCKNLFHGKLTYAIREHGKEMAPTMAPDHKNVLLIRKLPSSDSKHVFVGDAVILKDPIKSDNYLIRRLAAVEGYEMLSKDEKDEPFVLEKDQCWVLAENQELKSQEAYDSRTFGPVSMGNILGRAIYCLRTAVDHGPVNNSYPAMREDSSVLAIELDVEELANRQV